MKYALSKACLFKYALSKAYLSKHAEHALYPLSTL